MVRISPEIDVANAETGVFEQRIQRAEGLIRNMLEHKYLGSGHI
jgi:hypothetical protein